MTKETNFLRGGLWFKFNDLGQAQGIALKFCTSVAKSLKLKFRKFLGLIPTFVRVTEENLVELKKQPMRVY